MATKLSFRLLRSAADGSLNCPESTTQVNAGMGVESVVCVGSIMTPVCCHQCPSFGQRGAGSWGMALNDLRSGRIPERFRELDAWQTLSGSPALDKSWRVKGLAALAFFLVFTVLIATGMVMGVHGSSKGWWIMIASLVAYLGFFIKKGCLTQAH